MKHLIALTLAAVPFVAQAQITSGPVRVIDGDTLDMSGTRFRLQGIDAPELGQTCNRDGVAWTCGSEAASYLRELVSSKDVTCHQSDTDAYGRTVAICRVSSVDLGRAVVDAGLAIVLPNAPEGYAESEALRRNLKMGLWASVFDPPSTYRAAHPQRQEARSSASLLARPARSGRLAGAVSPSSGVFFRNCAEAWAVGAAPLYRGRPGYRSEMDGDNDGVACEPYRGRR
jgi:endonuclease YncB( thermonuclease family)